MKPAAILIDTGGSAGNELQLSTQKKRFGE
jgi:hypothetical protein